MRSGDESEGGKSPSPIRPTASARGTGDAQATGGFANSGVTGNNSITHVDRQYRLVVGRGIAPALMLLLLIAAIIRIPEGRVDQYFIPIGLLALAVVATTLLTALENSGTEAVYSLRMRLLVAALCLPVAIGGALRVEYLRTNGEIFVSPEDLTIEGGKGAAGGSEVTLTLNTSHGRSKLRATASIEDTFPKISTCKSQTTLKFEQDAQVQGPEREITNGETVDLRLNGTGRIEIRLKVKQIRSDCPVDVNLTNISLRG